MSGIKYNPLINSDIYIFTRERPRAARIFILEKDEGGGTEDTVTAVAAGGKIYVEMNDAKSITVIVNGKKTNNFSIKFKGKKQKRRWGAS